MANMRAGGVMFSHIARQERPEMIVVEVGPGRVKYSLHRDHLVRSSRYFVRLLSGPWKEAEDKLVDFSDVEEGPFRLFVEWLYTGTIPDLNDECLGEILELPEEKADTYWTFILSIAKAYVLGDRILATAFRRDMHNKFVDEENIFRKAGTGFYEIIQWCFANICEESEMLQFLVDAYAQEWKSKSGVKDGELRKQLPQEFLHRVLSSLSEPGTGKSTGRSLRIHCKHCGQTVYKCYYSHNPTECAHHTIWNAALGTTQLSCDLVKQYAKKKQKLMS